MAGNPKKRRRRRRRSPYMAISEGPGKQHYLGRLNWLLQFINADIDAMSYKEFIGAFYDYLTYLYVDWHGAVAREGTVRSICHDTDLNRQQLKKSQKIFRKEIEYLQSEFIAVRPGSTLISLKNILPLSYYLHFDGRLILGPNTRILPRTADKEIDDKIEGNKARLTHFSDFCVAGFETAIKYFLYSLLKRVSLDSIYCCPDCDKYCKRTKKKTSPYCPRCLRKRTLNEWRIKNRARYNDYQNSLRTGELENYKATWK